MNLSTVVSCKNNIEFWYSLESSHCMLDSLTACDYTLINRGLCDSLSVKIFTS